MQLDSSPGSLAAEMPLALAVDPAVIISVGNVRELIEWMRRNPALANVGSPGVSSVPNRLQAMLFRQADVTWQHVVNPRCPVSRCSRFEPLMPCGDMPKSCLRQMR